MAGSKRDDRREGEESEGEIKVTDRRLFTVAGDLRQEVAEDEDDEREVQAASQSRAEPGPPPRAHDPGFEHRSVNEPRGVDFTLLINGMAQTALLYLGEIPHPGTGEAEIDLEQARIHIDLLELLTVKCRGNLSQDEEGLLNRVLYQLRMLYVSRSSTPRG